MVSLLKSLECVSDEKASGSVVGFESKDGLRFTLHRPHRTKEMICTLIKC